jgi:hypothetical protein
LEKIRSEIAEENSVPPGGVWGGSAAFLLGIYNLTDLQKISQFDVVVTDYYGNETIQSVSPQGMWITEASTSFFDDRNFIEDESGNVTYLK